MSKHKNAERMALRILLLLVIIITCLLILWARNEVEAAASQPVPVPTAAEFETLTQALFVIVGGLLVRPITAIMQGWGLTATLDARAIAAVLSLMFVGFQGYTNGLYGPGFGGVVSAVAATALAFLNSYGGNRAESLAAEGAQRRALLAPAERGGDVCTLDSVVPSTSTMEPFTTSMAEPEDIPEYIRIDLLDSNGQPLNS